MVQVVKQFKQEHVTLIRQPVNISDKAASFLTLLIPNGKVCGLNVLQNPVQMFSLRLMMRHAKLIYQHATYQIDHYNIRIFFPKQTYLIN